MTFVAVTRGVVDGRAPFSATSERVIRCAVLAVLLSTPVVFAKGKGSGSGSNTESVQVNGYTRKDGTRVAPHHRSAPNKTKADNWSAKGNVNPYKVDSRTNHPDAVPAQSPPEKASSIAIPEATKVYAPRTTSESTSSTKVRDGMTKAEVATLLGEPNVKTATKWYYKTVGWLNFSEDGRLVVRSP